MANFFQDVDGKFIMKQALLVLSAFLRVPVFYLI